MGDVSCGSRQLTSSDVSSLPLLSRHRAADVLTTTSVCLEALTYVYSMSFSLSSHSHTGKVQHSFRVSLIVSRKNPPPERGVRAQRARRRLNADHQPLAPRVLGDATAFSVTATPKPRKSCFSALSAPSLFLDSVKLNFGAAMIVQ